MLLVSMGYPRHIFTQHFHGLPQIYDRKFRFPKKNIHFHGHFFVPLLGSMFPGVYRLLIYVAGHVVYEQ